MRDCITFFPQGEQSFLLNFFSSDVNDGEYRLIKENVHQQQLILLLSEQGLKKLGASNRKRIALLMHGEGDQKANLDLLIDKFFIAPNIYNFYMNLEFKKSAPFILVAYDDDSLFELKWDGASHGLSNLNTSNSYLWNSDSINQKKTITQPQGSIIENIDNSKIENSRADSSLKLLAGFFPKESNGQTRITSITTITASGPHLKAMHENKVRGTITEF